MAHRSVPSGAKARSLGALIQGPEGPCSLQQGPSSEDASGEAGVEEEFAVAFHAEDGRVDEGEGLAA